MSAPDGAEGRFRVAGGASVLLLLAAGFLGYLSGLPGALGVLLVAVPAAAGIVLRSNIDSPIAGYAPVPALGGLVVGTFLAPLGLVPELAAGAAGLAFLLWLAEDPSRPSGGGVRARRTILVPALTLAIGWSTALLLPSNSASLGVAAALLAGALLALAFLVANPSVFDRGSPSTTS